MLKDPEMYDCPVPEPGSLKPGCWRVHALSGIGRDPPLRAPSWLPSGFPAIFGVPCPWRRHSVPPSSRGVFPLSPYRLPSARVHICVHVCVHVCIHGSPSPKEPVISNQCLILTNDIGDNPIFKGGHISRCWGYDFNIPFLR